MPLAPVLLAAASAGCGGYEVSGAGDAAVNGCYLQSGEAYGSPKYLVNSTQGLYEYDGVWRIGQMSGSVGVRTQYVAVSRSHGPPSLPAEWVATGGAAPGPELVWDGPGTPAPPPTPQPVTPPPLGPPSFQDEFEGTSLNLSKWNVLSQVHRGGVYTPDMVRVSNGSLVITTQPRNLTVDGLDYYVVSGAVNTSRKFSQRLGRWEARVRLPDVDATAGYTLHTSVWLFEEASKGSGCSQEIDIVEQYAASPGPSSLGAGALHPYTGGHGSACQKLPSESVYRAKRNFIGWHVFTLDWTADSITMSIDGDAVGTVRGDVASKFTDPQFFLLTACVMNRVPAASGDTFPQHYHVDYVRVWEWA